MLHSFIVWIHAVQPYVYRYATDLIVAGVLLNAGLPSALLPTDPWTDPNTFKQAINKIRRTKAYSMFRQLVSLCALSVLWGKNAIDPKQREMVEKIVAPVLSILGALYGSPDNTADAASGSTQTTPITSDPPVVKYTLSGPVLTNLDGQNIDDIAQQLSKLGAPKS